MKTPALTKILLTSFLVVGAANALPVLLPVTGSINIASTAPSSFNASSVTFGAGNNSIVTSATGSYTGLFLATVHYNSFTYLPFSGPISPLRSTTSGSPTSSFNLTSISSRDYNPGFSLSLSGLGVAKVAGFDDTVGKWTFTASQDGTIFGFDSINSPAPRVPDGGATLALLGVGILGLGGMRRLLPSLKK